VGRKSALGTLRNCRELLTPEEDAILNMVAGRQASIIGVARSSARLIEDLWKLYDQACETLAVAFGYCSQSNS